MPIYEYKCNKCGVVEVMQRITEAPLRKCPNCKNKVERMMSRSSFVLKGSGWYATDYANKGKSSSEPSKESSTPANGTTSSESSSKTESKPANSTTSSTEKTSSAKA